jgi:hypothetical protein
VRPANVSELISVVTNSKKFPSPVRAVGAFSASTRCAAADGGTVVDMSKMNRILEFGDGFIRVQAGARLYEVSRELHRRGLEFAASPAPSVMSMGSAACGATVAPAMPGQTGQLSSYAVAMKLVTPAGEMLNVDRSKPELLRLLRCSYGLLGLVYEITLLVRPQRALKLRYDQLPLQTVLQLLTALDYNAVSLGLQVFPFRRRVAVEHRGADAAGRGTRRAVWRLRRWVLQQFQPGVGGFLARIPFRKLRYGLIDGLNQVLNTGLGKALSGAGITTADRIVRWPGNKRVRQSIWVFPAATFAGVLEQYVDFCRNHFEAFGYRCNLPTACEVLSGDNESALSVSFDGPVVTLEPRSTTEDGWEDFLVDFNDFCSRLGGRPLFNQTRGLSRDQARYAYGARLENFAKLRKKVDPHDRLLNAYFEQILA